jgi:hypothetical protein
MKSAGFLLLPASICLLSAVAPFKLTAAVVYYNDDQAPEFRVQWSTKDSELLSHLLQRVALTTLPASDPDRLCVTPGGEARDAAQIRLIVETDRQLAALEPDELKRLLAAVVRTSSPDPELELPAAPPSSPSSTSTGSDALVFTPQLNLPVAEAGPGLWAAIPPVAGSPQSLASARAELHRQTAMVLLEQLAPKEPAATLARFSEIAPDLAAKCLKAAPDLQPMEPLAYLGATGDVLALARSVATTDPGLALKWYLSHRSLGLNELDSGLTELVSDIVRRDPIAASALVSRLPASDLDSAADGIARLAETNNRRVLLVESLRQPRAAAIQTAVLHSIGHQVARIYSADGLSHWSAASGFTPDEQRLLQEGASIRNRPDADLEFLSAQSRTFIQR